MLGSQSPFGHRLVGSDGTPIAYSVSALAGLKAIATADRVHGQQVLIDNGKRYRFRSDGALTGDDQLVVTPDAGTGRWQLLEGAVTLAIPFTSATADAAILYTFPTGSIFQLLTAFYVVSTTFAGGTNSGIGVSSSNLTGFTTKGDIIAETVAAALVSTAAVTPGTIGAVMDTLTEQKTAIFTAGKTIRHDRTTSAFTSGAATLYCSGILIANPGA
jgi:hypothetical protein